MRGLKQRTRSPCSARIIRVAGAVMLDGFWTVQFQGPQGRDGGVAVFTRGKIFGGDSGYTYIGAYEENNNEVKARVSVQNFIPSVRNVMGLQGNFELESTCSAS